MGMVSDSLGWLCSGESRDLLSFACTSLMGLSMVMFVDRTMNNDGISALRANGNPHPKALDCFEG